MFSVLTQRDILSFPGLLCCLCVVTALTGCAPTHPTSSNSQLISPSTNSPVITATKANRFEVKGWLKEMDAAQRKVRILHDDIPGYMEKMSMEFEVRGATEWPALKVGDRVAFTLQATESDGWIEGLRPSTDVAVSATSTNSTAAITPILPIPRIAHYQPLLVGDTLPDYPLTNHLGQSMILSQFRGQAIAFTFFFTTCPFPTMCPRMTTNFRDAYRDLLTNTGTMTPTNWHLFSITIDPQRDTPEMLKDYARRNDSSPEHWTYLTGDGSQIEILGRHFGLNFFLEAGALNHNLRTVVVNPKGKITKIFTGNEWKSSELAEEMRRALKE